MKKLICAFFWSAWWASHAAAQITSAPVTSAAPVSWAPTRAGATGIPTNPYAAAAALDQRLSPQARVVEIGAGMSTLWLSQRVTHVTSYEWNPVWYERLAGHLRREQVSNVDLRFCSGHDELAFADVRDASLDVIYVDGGPRSLCIERLWPKLRFGGLAYLDNWDSDLFWLEGEIDARAFLDRQAAEVAERLLFVDFVPGAFSVNEGLLVTKGHRPAT